MALNAFMCIMCPKLVTCSLFHCSLRIECSLDKERVSRNECIQTTKENKKKNKKKSDAPKNVFAASLNKALDIEMCCLQKGEDIFLDMKRLR